MAFPYGRYIEKRLKNNQISFLKYVLRQPPPPLPISS